MADDLDTKTDEQLNDVFAREVAGWSEVSLNLHKRVKLDAFFANSADTLLPWLEEQVGFMGGKWLASSTFDKKWNIIFSYRNFYGERCSVFGLSSTFARAACIALIRATRVEKVGVA